MRHTMPFTPPAPSCLTCAGVVHKLLGVVGGIVNTLFPILLYKLGCLSAIAIQPAFQKEDMYAKAFWGGECFSFLRALISLTRDRVSITNSFLLFVRSLGARVPVQDWEDEQLLPALHTLW